MIKGALFLVLLFSNFLLVAQNFDYKKHPFYKVYENKSLPDSERIIGIINLAGQHRMFSIIDTPIKLTYIGLGMSEKIGFLRGVASAYRQLGTMYTIKGDMVKALETTLKALSYIDVLKKKYAANRIHIFYVSLLGQLTGVYNRLNIQQKADSVGKLSIKLADEIGDKEVRAVCHGNYGSFLMDHAIDYQRALDEFKVVASIQLNLGYTSLADISLYNQSVLYNRLNKFDSALQILKRLEKSSSYKTDQTQRLEVNSSLADVYFHMEDFDSAEKKYLELADDANKGGILFRQKEAFEKLYAIYERKNNFPMAYDYYKRFIGARDSIDNLDKRVEVTKAELKFESEKKAAVDKEIINRLKLAALLKEQKTKIALNKEKIRYISLELSSAKKSFESQKLVLAERQKKDQVIQASEKNKMLLRQEISNTEIKRKYTLIFSAILLLLLLVIFYFLRKKQSLESTTKEQILKSTVIENQMKILKLQLNPHFLFNSLNSISDYIQKNNIQDADEYLTKFAKLMRYTLENSEEKEILLSEELSMIELYVQLESKRLGNKVNYNLSVQDSVDVSTLLVPPSILQPLVENSIWHGLSSKEQGGIVSIDIRLENGMLLIHVDDNGVGRKNVQVLSKNKKSFGFSLTKERIAILNHLKKTNATIDIHDLPVGTRVVLQLPLMKA